MVVELNIHDVLMRSEPINGKTIKLHVFDSNLEKLFLIQLYVIKFVSD